MILSKSNRKLMRVRGGAGLGLCRSAECPRLRRIVLKRRSGVAGQINVSFLQQGIVQAELRSPQGDRIGGRKIVGKYRAIKVSESNQLCALPWIKTLDVHWLQTESIHVHSLPFCRSYTPPANCRPIFCIVRIGIIKVHLDPELGGEVFRFIYDAIMLEPDKRCSNARGSDFHRRAVGQSVPDVFFSGGVAVVIPAAGRGSEDGSTEVALVFPEVCFAPDLRVIHRQVPRQLAKPDVEEARVRSQGVGILIRRSRVIHPAEILKNAVCRVVPLDAAETAFADINKAVVSHLRPLRTFLAQLSNVLRFSILRVIRHEMTRVTACEVNPVLIKTGGTRPGASKDAIGKAGAAAREIHIQDLKRMLPAFRDVVAHQQMQIVARSGTKHDLPFLRVRRNEAAESFQFERAVGQNVAGRIRYCDLHQLRPEHVGSAIRPHCQKSVNPVTQTRGIHQEAVGRSGELGAIIRSVDLERYSREPGIRRNFRRYAYLLLNQLPWTRLCDSDGSCVSGRSSENPGEYAETERC